MPTCRCHMVKSFDFIDSLIDCSVPTVIILALLAVLWNNNLWGQVNSAYLQNICFDHIPHHFDHLGQI